VSGYGRNRPWRSTPLPRGWARIRLAILQRDGGRCRIRGPQCQGAATEVDHIDPTRPDDHSDANLQAACRPCHATKTGRENAARTNARRGSARRPDEPHPGLRPPGGGE
jgi:5-methylcytosine-specific restriction endonuclease McrA